MFFTKHAGYILIVDDDVSLCDALSEVLKQESYKPVTCHHPRDALVAIHNNRDFELAFVDIHLPEMDGLELGRRLKSDLPGLEIAFITGYGTFENAVQALKIGAYDYLRKPFSMDEFKLCLRRFEERKALKERARQADSRYKLLVENLPVLIFSIGKDFRLEFINQASQGMLGYAPEEAKGLEHGFLSLVHPEDRRRIRRLIKRMMSSTSPSPFSTECRLIHKKGFIVHTLLKTISENRFPGSAQWSIEGLAVDITDRVLLEKSAIQNERLKTLGTISAEVAHEIRNPLISIGGFANRLKKRLPACQELDIILTESGRLERLVQRINNYLRPSIPKKKTFSLNSILKRSLVLLSPEIEKYHIKLDVNLNKGIKKIELDADLLTEVFINLIRNAIFSLHEGGTLHIRSYETNGNICIEFKNRMEKRRVKKAEKLFLPFGEGGKSIGLPLSFRLVKNMGGLLSFSQEGDFAVFTVTFSKSGSLPVPDQDAGGVDDGVDVMDRSLESVN